MNPSSDAPTTEQQEFIGHIPLDEYGESVHSFYKVSLKNHIRYPENISATTEHDKYLRRQKCEKLRFTRAAKRRCEELGLVITHTGCGRDCTGRRFNSYVDIICVDTIYEYAIVRVSSSIDN